MKSKKFLLGVTTMATVLGTVLSLASCGATKGTPNFDIPEGGFDKDTKVSITFYSTMSTTSLVPVVDDAIVEFNKLYPNIVIDHKQPGSYNDVRDQIKTELAVGQGPNMAYCYPDHIALYNKAKKVVTLDNLIDDKKNELGLTDAEKADYIEGYYTEGKQFGDELMYSMPFSKSTEVLYYNKTFFDANNLTVPTTWDEMETVCKEIKRLAPNSTPLGVDSASNWFITMCEQLGSGYTSASGNHFLFNNDTNKAFVKKFASWYQQGLVTTQGLYGAYTSGLFTKTDGTQAYMCIGSSAGASYQAINGQEVGITQIPHAANGKMKVISQGPSVCIFKKENPQEVMASWLFLKYLTTSVAFQAQFGMKSGYVPVIKSVGDNEVYKAYLAQASTAKAGLPAAAAKVALAQADYYYTSPAFIGSSTARDQVGDLLEKAMSTSGLTDEQLNKLFTDAISECEYDAA